MAQQAVEAPACIAHKLLDSNELLDNARGHAAIAF